MNRVIDDLMVRDVGIPHERGDEPDVNCMKYLTSPYSPRAWG